MSIRLQIWRHFLKGNTVPRLIRWVCFVHISPKRYQMSQSVNLSSFEKELIFCCHKRGTKKNPESPTGISNTVHRSDALTNKRQRSSRWARLCLLEGPEVVGGWEGGGINPISQPNFSKVGCPNPISQSVVFPNFPKSQSSYIVFCLWFPVTQIPFFQWKFAAYKMTKKDHQHALTRCVCWITYTYLRFLLMKSTYLGDTRQSDKVLNDTQEKQTESLVRSKFAKASH